MRMSSPDTQAAPTNTTNPIGIDTATAWMTVPVRTPRRSDAFENPNDAAASSVYRTPTDISPIPLAGVCAEGRSAQRMAAETIFAAWPG